MFTLLVMIYIKFGNEELMVNALLSVYICREKTGHTPYMVSKDKATRNEFRKFMGKWPDKYDYNKAQVDCL